MSAIEDLCEGIPKERYEKVLAEYNRLWAQEFSKLASYSFDTSKIGGDSMSFDISPFAVWRNDVKDSPKNISKNYLTPIKIIYNNKTTVCYFKDGSKEIVHCAEGEEFVKEVGVMSCIMKKLFATRNEFKRLVNSGYTQPTEK